jgi:ubiquinone biosynthesis protein
VLKRSLIPSPLIDPADREIIRIDDRGVHLRFRGLFVLASLFRLALKLTWFRATRRLDDRELGRHLTDFCERLGVLWMKVGQLLSIRGELLPQDARDELARLQDRARGFEPDAAIRFVEQELGAPLPELFAEFERIPFAAASISQVHRARLKHEGVRVAIKVQRPSVERIFARDMALIRGLVSLLRRLSVMPHVRWDDLLWELEHLVREELDYRFEATNISRMKKKLKAHNVYVPKVFRRYSTRRVLTMEYIQGVILSDYL